VYVVDLDEDAAPVRVVADNASERHTAFGPDGVTYASDATETGHYNLFTVDLHSGDVTRRTAEARDHLEPARVGDGLWYVAWDGERRDLFEVTNEGAIRRTKVTTGLTHPGPPPTACVRSSRMGDGRTSSWCPATCGSTNPSPAV
jgi:Tol biopolymer transport system component